MAVDLFRRVTFTGIQPADPGGGLSEQPGSGVDSTIALLEQPDTKTARTIDTDIPGTANGADLYNFGVPFAFYSASSDATIGSVQQPIDDLYLGRGTTNGGTVQDMGVHASDGGGDDVVGDSLNIHSGAGSGTAAGGNVSVFTAPAGSGELLDVGLVGYWKMDETSGTRTDQTGNNDLTDNNTVTGATGKINGAGQFTRANSEYLSATVTAGDPIQVGELSFTWAGWVYIDSSHLGVIASQYGNTDALRVWQLYYDNGADRFTFVLANGSGTNSTVVANNFGGITLATWYYIVAWRDVAGSINIQVNNGTADTTATTTVPLPITQPFYLGANGSGGAGSNAFDGRIDEVGFWKRLLTAAEKTSLYNGGSGLAYDASNAIFAEISNHSTINTALERARFTDGGKLLLYGVANQYDDSAIGTDKLVIGPGSDGVVSATITTSTGATGIKGTFSIPSGSAYVSLNSQTFGSGVNKVPLVFFTGTEGNSAAVVKGVEFANGVILNTAAGARPTGSFKGYGTLNVATDIYKNNSAYGNPDFVFEHCYRKGGVIKRVCRHVETTSNAEHVEADCVLVDDERTAEIANTYAGVMPLEELEQHVSTKFALPHLAKLAPTDGFFGKSEGLLAAIEELVIHVIGLNKRVKELENAP